MTVAVLTVLAMIAGAPQQPLNTTSSTSALAGLIQELQNLEKVMTASTSTSAAAPLSEEGVEVLESRASTTAPSALEVVPERPAPPPVPSRTDIRLVYTGALSGLGAEHYSFHLPLHLADVLEGRGEITGVTPIHGILVQGVSILIADDGRAATLVKLFAPGQIRCGLPEEAWSVRTPSERMLVRIGEEWLPDSRLPAWLNEVAPQGTRREYEVRICRNEASGVRALLYSPMKQVYHPPIWRLERFEFRRGLHLRIDEDGLERTVDIVGVPESEAARRFHLLETAAQDRDRLLYVDAGSFVDGSSRLEGGGISILRPLAFEMLTRLRPAALVPGKTELLPGASQFTTEAQVTKLPYLATNWTSTDPRLALPRSVIREIETEAGPVRVAFLGVVDPEVAATSGRLKGEGITIDDPLTAVAAEVHALRVRKDAPDLVVLLTTANPNLIDTLQARLRGVDLIIGDTSAQPHTLRRLHLDFTSDQRASRPVAATLPLESVGVADLSFLRRGNRWVLRALDVALIRTTEHLRPDLRVQEILSRQRSKVYPTLEQPLLAQRKAGPLQTMKDDEWRRAVCEAVRRAADADVAFLPDTPPADRAPGPQTGIVLSDRLAVLDQLAHDELRGEDLSPLLLDPPPYITTVCGALTRVTPPKVLGRDLTTDRVYRIVTTDRALALGLGAKLTQAHGNRLFERLGAETMIRDDGEPLTLRHAVLGYFREETETSTAGITEIEPLLVDSGLQKHAAWLLSFDRIALQLERFRGANDAAYSRVPDALANAPSSLSVGFAGDGALVYDGAKFLADFRIRARYHRLELQNAPAQQLEDDLRFSSSAVLPGVSLPTGPLPWSPFVEGLFDTEFRHEFDANGNRLPKRADLSLTLGLSTRFKAIDRLRIGALALRDLSRPERPTVIGARTEAKVIADLGRGLHFITQLDGAFFGKTREDDARDLRFKLYIESRLDMPLARHLAVAPYARLFVFEGRVPETEHVQRSYLLGLSFELRGAFEL